LRAHSDNFSALEKQIAENVDSTEREFKLNEDSEGEPPVKIFSEQSDMKFPRR